MLAVAAIAFAGCQKEVNVVNSDEITHYATVSIGKPGETKTAVDEGEASASYKWTEGDEAFISVYENGNKGKVESVTYNDTKTIATLNVSFTGTPTAPYIYTAKYFKEESSSHNPLVLAEQNPKADNFDPAADIMISEEINGQENRLTSLQFTMGRVVTVNKMTLTGLAEGEKVSKVEFTLDKNVVAYYVQSSGNYSPAGTKLTMKYDESPITVPSNGKVSVYFVAAPVENAAIKSVVVTTDTNVYTKSDALAPNPFSGKTITFAVGTMKRFSMDMTGFGEPIPTGVKYYKVTSSDQIVDGGKYLIVSSKADGNLVAMGAFGSSLYTPVDVTETQDSNKGNYIEIEAEAVNPVTLEDAGDGAFYIVDSDSDYLYYTGSNNNISRSNEFDAKSKWTVSTNQIVNVSITSRKLQYNRSSPRFACYTGTQTDVTLYVREGSIPEDTRTPVTLSFNPATVGGITVGDSFDEPTLTKNPNNVPVTYTVATEPDGIAIIDAASGELSITGAGTITVTAAVSDEVNFKPASVSYTLTVNELISDYSIAETSNVTLSVDDGTNASSATVNGKSAIKAGTGKASGAVVIVVPAGTTKLHLHAVGWNGESVTLGITGASASPSSLSLTSNTAISGSGTSYSLSDVANYYSCILLDGITSATQLTFSATSGNRFVIWGVNAEAGTPKVATPTFSITDSNVSIACDTEGAKIYYTVDGTDPSTSSSEYTGAVSLIGSNVTTIKAIATKSEYDDSEIASQTYYAINVNGTTNGSVTAKPFAAKNDEISLTITPDNGYKLDELTVNDSSDQEVEVTNNKFTMPASPVTVSASFTEEVGGSTTKLRNEDIVASTGSTSYGIISNLTDEKNNSYSAYAIKNHHSKATSSYEFLQIKKYASGTASYIQIPKLGTKITSITMTVSSSQQPMTGGGNSATLYFSANNSTSAAGAGVASGTGASSVTIDCSSLNLNTGYITASGAVRIWDIEVTYDN